MLSLHVRRVVTSVAAIVATTVLRGSAGCGGGRFGGRRFSRLRRRSVAIVASCVWLFGAVAAQAHQSPAGCNTNGLTVNISRNPPTVINGGTVTYMFAVANLDSG